MTTRKRVAAARPRALSCKGSAALPARKSRDSALNPARFLPTHERYTPALLAHIRRRFEETPERMASMAADLGVVPQSLHRIARRYGWVRRNREPPLRDLPPALKILQEAEALEAGAPAVSDAALHLSPLAGRGRHSSEARMSGEGAHREGKSAETAPHPDPLPASGERERAACVETIAAHSGPDTPVAPALSTIERLERAVLAELAPIEAMRAAMGTLPQKPAGAALTVRTLNMLTQTLQHLQRLRASAVLAAQQSAAKHSERDHDDDMPADIDEFRRDLARRIDAFVASRTEPGDVRGDTASETVDEVRS